MKDLEKLRAALDELEMKYEHKSLEEDVEHFEVVLDAEEELSCSVLAFGADGETMLRIFVPVDDLLEDDTVPQLSLLMALNGEISTGCFCMDPEELTVYATVALPLGGIDSAMLRMLIESLVFARELYLDEFYPLDGDMPES